MPRPSLTEEILRLVGDACTATGYAMASPPMSKQEGRHYRDAETAKDAISSRLTALETELEGYRKEEMAQVSVGRSEGGGDRPSVVNARWPSASESFGLGKIGSGTTQPSDLAASHSIALPCSSEYVNAQADREHE